MKAKMPFSKLNSFLQEKKYESNKIDHSVLDQLGFYVVKDFFDTGLIDKYYLTYKKALGIEAQRTKHHLTEVTFALDSKLAGILEEDSFKQFSKQFFNGNVGLYNIRIVKKDSADKSPVFLHQDIGYHYGSTDRYSFFIPLTECNPDNGSLTFVPGSHKFGYMGDAGALNDEIIPKELDLATPSVYPGDIIVMNSFTWHRSGENKSGHERVYYDIHVNDSRDPSVKKVIVGEGQSDYLFDYSPDITFTNSRMQRLKNLYKQIELKIE